MALKTNDEIKKFVAVPKYSDAELAIMTNYRAEFLKKIYPFLNDDEYNDGCIEIRPLNRAREEQKDYIKSFNAWHMTEKDIENLKKFGKMVNGKKFCLYYSLYAQDYAMKVEGKIKGKINQQNALFTTVLGMDFDYITIEEFNKYKQSFLDVGLETIDIWTGHGVQSIILLNRKYYDKELLSKFVKVVLQKDFPIDSVTTDCARVFRLPYTFNCKEFSKKKEYPNPNAVNVFVVNDTDKRYSAGDVFRALQKIPDAIPPDKDQKEDTQLALEIEAIPTKPFVAEKPQKPEKPSFTKEYAQIEFKDIAVEYPLDFTHMEPAIRKILSGTPDGLRNQVLLFLVPFFKNALKVSLEHAINIMQIWDKHCVPSQEADFIKAEVTRLWKEKYKYKFGTYTKELEDYYGKINFEEYRLDNTILIPNIFYTHLHNISDGAVQIYLSLLLDNKVNDAEEWTAEDIVKCAKISLNTFYRNINMLIIPGFLDKHRSYRKSGEEYVYRINTYKFYTGTYGYTKLEVAVAKLMLMELTKGEIPLYMLLRHSVLTSSNGICYMSQEHIGEMLGKARPTVCNSTTALNSKRYIKKTTTTEGGISHTTYTLIY